MDTDGLRAGLADNGYLERQDIHIEYRWAYGRFDQLPAFAEELVSLKPEVIVAVVTAPSLAAQAATRSIPIVMVGVGDPVGVGLVASLARPGGNITGTSTLQAELVGKQLELVQALDPALTRIAVLWNPANSAFQALQLKQAQDGARTLGVQLRMVEASTAGDLPTAFKAIRDEGTRALVILSDPAFVLHRRTLIDLATETRLITVCGTRDLADAGCLASYGPNYFDTCRHAVGYVHKILRGVSPADLPVEQSTRFDLVFNLKTVKALGLEIPPTLLARADEVIE